MLRETDTAKNQCAAKLNSLTQPYITKQRKIISLKTIQERIYRDAKFFYDSQSHYILQDAVKQTNWTNISPDLKVAFFP
jgi:hypothetical protein